MKKIIGLGLLLVSTSAFIGCTTTEGNTNLRNANSNTGYVVSNANAATPMPAYTPATVTNTTMNSNMKPVTNSNMKPVVNSNMNSNANSNMGNKTKANKEGK